MTVGIVTPRVVLSHTGPGTYSFTFPVLEEGFLEVSHRDTDGSITSLTISTDYTVSLNADTTGDITLIWDSPSGGPYTGDIILERNIPIEQDVDWVNGGPLDMEQLEDAFDKLTMIVQQLDNTITVGASAYNYKGAWSTGAFYSVNDLVKESKNLYICTEDHTAGTFATDLSAGKWELLIDITDIADSVGILDEDDFASDDATKAPSQQSTGAYIASQILDEDDFASDDATKAPSQQSTAQYLEDRLQSNVNMGGAIFRGHGISNVSLAANTDLNNTTHRAAALDFTTASTLTIKPNSTTSYSSGFQCVVTALHASGCTVGGDSGVDLNGVDGGSFTINQYETYSLRRIGTDDWVAANASVS